MAPEARTVTEFVAAPAAQVYEFAHTMETLPMWASGLAAGVEQENGEWFTHSPMGRVKVEMAARNGFGVLDHDVTLPDGSKVHNAFRVTPAAGHSVLTFVVLRMPGTSAEDFARDVDHVSRDLKKLKSLLEEARSLPNVADSPYGGPMDSINKQQPEINRRDISDADAVERIQSTVKKTQSCFFCTRGVRSDSNGTRPMSVQKVDDDGALWFLSASDSHKNAEIAQDSTVALFFQGSEHADFLQLIGKAGISTDRQVIKALWKPILKTWFTEGEDDPRITAIKVEPHTGYYWDNKHGSVVAGAKMLVGAAIGKTLDDSIEGRLSLR